jgi:hypothetical protein
MPAGGFSEPRDPDLALDKGWHSRYKGEAENALHAAGFPRLYIFRPAYIYPVEPRKEPNVSSCARSTQRSGWCFPTR